MPISLVTFLFGDKKVTFRLFDKLQFINLTNGGHIMIRSDYISWDEYFMGIAMLASSLLS